VIPDSVATINYAAFESCSALTSVILGNSLDTISISAFAYTPITSITFPSSVRTIANYAFLGTDITSVTVPLSVTSLGEVAFDSDCTVTRA
jgi:BspA type Leucine rich repeat region (6 copies)